MFFQRSSGLGREFTVIRLQSEKEIESFLFGRKNFQKKKNEIFEKAGSGLSYFKQEADWGGDFTVYRFSVHNMCFRLEM